MTTPDQSRSEVNTLSSFKKASSKRSSVVVLDESTETIAALETDMSEVHIEIANDDDNEKQCLSKRTVPFEKVPVWMQDNAFITDAYRPPLFSYKACVKSLFYQHNESGKEHFLNINSHIPCYAPLLIYSSIVNIWSHLLGVILFLVIGILSWFVFLAPLRPVLGAGDIAVFYVFILGAMVCLAMSTSFHCFLSHSEKVSKKGVNHPFWEVGWTQKRR